MPPLARFIAALAASATLAACSFDTFTYSIDRYGTVESRVVHLGCDDSYEVYDRPDSGTLLVGTNLVNEGLATTCSGAAGLPKDERMRRVARRFLEETSDRPACRIDRERALGDAQTEFYYRCPPPRLRPTLRG